MRTVLVTAVTLIVLTAAGCPPAAIAGIWDDFKGKKLDSAKWMGDQFGTPGAIALELRREIVGGKLLMSHRAVGDGGGVSTNRLVFRNASPFTSIQYTVKVNAVSTTDCGGPISVANISQFNFLFNTDDAGLGCGGGVTCDVFAVFYMDHVTTDGANTAQVHGSVVARPTDGSLETLLGLVEFGTVKKGTPLNVTLAWNEAAKTVTFDVKIKNVTTTRVVDYGALNNTGTGGARNSIEASEFVCGPGGVAESSSSWDNIVVTP